VRRVARARGATRLAAAMAERWTNMAGAIGVEWRGWAWLSSLEGRSRELTLDHPAEGFLALIR
jgi:hypothetical protein